MDGPAEGRTKSGRASAPCGGAFQFPPCEAATRATHPAASPPLLGGFQCTDYTACGGGPEKVSNFAAMRGELRRRYAVETV